MKQLNKSDIMEALEKYKKQNMESFYYCDAIKHTQFDITNDTSDCTTCKYMNGSMVVEPCFSCKGTGGEELNYVELL